MKKFVKIMLAALLAAIAVTCFACAGGENGNDKKGLLYKQFSGEDYYTVYGYVDDDKTTVLDMAEYVKDKNISIGRIKANAFKGNVSLIEIIVPDTVKEIDEGAFAGMKSLEKITLPFIGATANADAFDHETETATDKSVDGERNFGYIFGTEEYDDGAAISQSYGSGDATTYYIPYRLTEVTVAPAKEYKLPMYAFNGCSNLFKVTLGDKVTAIGASAFENCSNLETVVIPASVKNIYSSAFAGCDKLKNYVENEDKSFKGLKLDDGATFDLIGDKAFYKTALKTVDFTVKEIGERAFAESSVTSVTLKNVKKIGSYAFNDCKKLETVSVTFAENVETEIGTCAFAGCEKANVFALAVSASKKGVDWNKDTKNA